MAETLLQESVRQQPALFGQILKNADALCSPFSALWERRSLDRLVLLGSGSSHHATLMARTVLEKALRVEVRCLLPSESAELSWQDMRRTLYLAVSQSGESTNVYELVRALRARNAAVLALTRDHGSPIAQAAGSSIALPVGDGQIASRGVTAFVLALMLMGLSGAESPDLKETGLHALNLIGNNMTQNLRRAEVWAQAQVPVLLPFRHLTVLGCGSAVGAAREGALELLEACCIPVGWYPLDEYFQGFQNVLDKRECLIGLLPASGNDRVRMLRLTEFARSTGAHCAIISEGALNDPDALCLTGTGLEEFSPLEFVPALQVLAAELSAARGIDLSRPHYPGFSSLMGSKLPHCS